MGGETTPMERAHPQGFFVSKCGAAPGAYRLSWRGAGGGAAASPRMIAALSCTTERALADPVAPVLANGLATADLSFAGGCTAPLLQFWLTPGADPVTISAIRLESRHTKVH